MDTMEKLETWEIQVLREKRDCVEFMATRVFKEPWAYSETLEPRVRWDHQVLMGQEETLVLWEQKVILE